MLAFDAELPSLSDSIRWPLKKALLLGAEIGMHQTIDLETLCHDRGMRITDQRRVIANVLSASDDHPNVDALHARASAIDPGISIATVYRTLRLFEEAGIIESHDFGDGKTRYEPSPDAHHDHLIDVETGQIIEFVDPELEALQQQVAERLGYRLVDHKMELFAVKLRTNATGEKATE